MPLFDTLSFLSYLLLWDMLFCTLLLNTPTSATFKNSSPTFFPSLSINFSRSNPTLKRDALLTYLHRQHRMDINLLYLKPPVPSVNTFAAKALSWFTKFTALSNMLLASSSVPTSAEKLLL